MPKKEKKILISQPEPASKRSPYYDIAEKYNYDLEYRQLIKVVPVEASEFRRQRIDILSHTAIIFTSKTAIDNFFFLLKELRVTVPESMKYFCPSDTVALYLQKYIVYRKRKVFIGKNNGSTTELINTILKHSKENFFIPIPEDSDHKIATALEEKKINFSEGIMYRTVTRERESDDDNKILFDHDVIIFFSPYGIKALEDLCPTFKQGKKAIGAFGEATVKMLEEKNLRVDFSAPSPDTPSMASALELHLQKNAKK